MLATLTLMTALSLPPGQSDALRLTNERVTYGPLGPVRSDKKFLPGDVYYVNFDIEGLQTKDGHVRYSMKMELKGKTKFAGDPGERTVPNVLGGNRLPGFAHATIGLDTEPGEVTMEVTVTDLFTKATKTLKRTFEVAARDFGIVGLNPTYAGQVPAPPTVFVGQPYLLVFGITGFQRDRTSKQPKVQLQLNITDEATGKVTLAKPIVDEISKDVEEKATVLPGSFDLPLTRAGKFSVELKATDLLTNKTSTVTLPLTVLEPHK